MSEMVEKVTKAIFRVTFHESEPNEVVNAKWIEWPEDVALSRKQARAAIAAMWEPTAEMVAAAWASRQSEAEGTTPGSVFNHAWQAMIDEALK